MTAKVKSVLTIASEALETAAGYALLAVGIYSALFVDITGGGSLWNNLRHLKEGAAEEGVQSPNAVRVIKVPVQAAVEAPHEDRILAVFDTAPKKGDIAMAYSAPEATPSRPSAAFTDTPADPNTGATWKKGLKGEMRSFTVYGRGDQTTSASAKTAAPASAPVPQLMATAESPAGASAVARTGARPGMGSRLSRGALSASDTSRNIK